MEIKSVAVSAAVGKQVYAVPIGQGVGNSAAVKVVLRGLLLTPLSANARVVIREGNASGAIILVTNSLSARNPVPIELEEGKRFDTGMHVKVTGTGAVAYLYIA